MNDQLNATRVQVKRCRRTPVYPISFNSIVTEPFYGSQRIHVDIQIPSNSRVLMVFLSL